jgi:hypothetical protein
MTVNGMGIARKCGSPFARPKIRAQCQVLAAVRQPIGDVGYEGQPHRHGERHMRNMLRNVLTAGAFALCTIAGLTPVKAEVLRIVLVVADNATDYATNVALLPTLTALLKKGTGVKDVHVGTDAAKMSIATSSVWADEADISSVTGTADWKAATDKLSKPIAPYRVITEVFQITP